MTARYQALIAGASGVVGRRLAEHLAGRGDWEVTGLARRAPAGPCPFRSLAVDLTDAADCARKLGGLTGTTHILYAARYDHKTTEPEPIEINAGMLRNLVDAVEPAATGLQHIHMVQGSKYYGSLGPYKTPSKESDPRPPVNNFYYEQEDFIKERRRGKRWTWSATRPHAICDAAPGIARAIGMVIGVYAAICRESGEPLFFPGTAGNYRALYQCTDAAHLARAIAWMATEPRCADQGFNITNGDYIRWMNLWPVFADYFGIEPGPVRTISLAREMPGKAAVWERIVKKHGLRPVPYEKTVIWPYGDYVFGAEYDIMSSTTRARELGFHDVVDTERMFIELFDYYRREKILP